MNKNRKSVRPLQEEWTSEEGQGKCEPRQTSNDRKTEDDSNKRHVEDSTKTREGLEKHWEEKQKCSCLRET